MRNFQGRILKICLKIHRLLTKTEFGYPWIHPGVATLLSTAV